MASKKDTENTDLKPAPFDVQAKDRLTAADLHMLYPELARALEDAAVQEAATKAFKGYDSTGYGYQYIVNRFNQILGPSHWRETHTIVQDEMIPGGKTQYEIAMQMTIQVGNWRYNEATGESFFEILATRTLYGGHISKSKADALKGAFTNTFKKTAALYGPGRQAYEGSIDDDNADPDGAASAKVGGEQKMQGPAGRPAYGGGSGGYTNPSTSSVGVPSNGPVPVLPGGSTTTTAIGPINPSQKKAITNMLTLKQGFDLADWFKKNAPSVEFSGTLETDLGALTEDQAKRLIAALNSHK